MSLPFDTTTLPEPTEEEMKTLMAVVMQNSLMIQQLQLMVALKQKEMEEEKSREESQKQKERDVEEKEEKQKELREKEVRMMREWTEEESREYVKRFREHRGDRRCKKCEWFGHMAHHCRRGEIEDERKLREGSSENRWKPLEYRVMSCDEERMAACSMRKEAQQQVKC